MSEATHREVEWFDTVPRSVTRHVIFGALLLAVTFVGFGWWSLTAPLAAAVVSQGSFVASGQNKIVQHLEGGIIESIYVSEGDRVETGDILIRLDRTAALASEREVKFRLWRLEAIETRLLAQSGGREALEFPAHLEAARSDYPEIAGILDSQQLAFEVARTELYNTVRIMQRDIEALGIRSAGYQSQLTSSLTQLEILRGEYSRQTELLARGLVRRPEVSALQRVLVEAEGQVGRLQAEIDETAEVIARYEDQIQNSLDEYRRKALDMLQTTQTEIDVLRERLLTAQDVASRVEIPSPVRGTIVRLYYHTPGGVLESGKPIVEILPADVPLIVETLIVREDIDSVFQGQDAVVRLTGMNQRTTPVLDGKVLYISADSITDQSTGTIREVYVARIGLSPAETSRIPGLIPTPGMPAEVMIQTESRTFAQYLAQPILDSMSRAFREQ